MQGTDRMGYRRGSAIVLAMLLLVLLSALGMYAVSLPVSVGESFPQPYPSAVARNMARAGAHAGIALLPGAFPDATPYVRRFAVGPDVTGLYSVTSRKTGGSGNAPGPGEDTGFVDYTLVSDGSVSGARGARFRVRAEVRYWLAPSSGPRMRIRKWEEKGL
jgi:hypothetical protein